MFSLGHIADSDSLLGGGQQAKPPLTKEYARHFGMGQSEFVQGTTTHLSKLYGIIAVPDDKRAEFDARHARDFDQGHPARNLLAAISPRAFPFVCDLDMPEGAVSREHMLGLCGSVSRLLARFYGVDSGNAEAWKRFAYVVAMCPDSSNVHLHFPTLIVNQAVAIRLTTLLPAAVAALRLPGFADFGIVQLRKMFDSNIIARLGLRTIFSHKVGNCPSCQKPKQLRLLGQDATCGLCSGSGKAVVGGEGRVYDMEYLCVAPDAPVQLVNKDRVNSVSRLHLTRVYIPAAEIEQGGLLPVAPLELSATDRKLLDLDEEDAALSKADIQGVQDEKDNAMRSKPRRNQKKVRSVPLSSTLPKTKTRAREVPAFFLSALTRSIQKVDRELYGRAKVHSVHRTTNHLRVNVRASPILPCINHGRVPHSQRQVYFEVDLRTGEVYQRCTCQCDRIGVDKIVCSRFKSKQRCVMALPDDLFCGVRSMSYVGKGGVGKPKPKPKPAAVPKVPKPHAKSSRPRKRKRAEPHQPEDDMKEPISHPRVIPLEPFMVLARPNPTPAEQRKHYKQYKKIQRKLENFGRKATRARKSAKARKINKHVGGGPRLIPSVEPVHGGTMLGIVIRRAGEPNSTPVQHFPVIQLLTAETASAIRQESADPEDFNFVPPGVFKNVGEYRKYKAIQTVERQYESVKDCADEIRNRKKEEARAAKLAKEAANTEVLADDIQLPDDD